MMYDDYSLVQLVAAQRDVQALLGHDLDELTTAERMEYLRNQVLALQVEVVEVLNTSPWKPWATYPADAEIDDAEYVKELADVFIFFLNLLLAGDVSPNRLLEAVARKIEKNVERANSRYDGHWATTEA